VTGTHYMACLLITLTYIMQQLTWLHCSKYN